MSKSVDEAKTCSVCGTALSGVDESCPVCMLRKGLAGGVESGGSSASEDTVKPIPEQATQRFEHYTLVTDQDGTPVELGRGAMGITYKAFDVDLRCLVALKVITARYLHDESARLRFLREARAAASVRHPNVASVFHLGRTGEDYFYAMEFVEGETLERLIQRSGRLEVRPALEISAQVAAGLAAIHEQKLVHRDIKPSNIMVSVKDGNRVTAKIIDLGLSKTVAEAPSQPAISMPGAFAGTPEFASPEQFAGVGVDIRSDLYSFGVTLWQMLTGKLPFHGTPAELMYQHQHAPLPLEQLIDVPQPIVVLLQVLLEEDPKWRFQNPTELMNALPKVNDAIKARRTITHQSLRELTDQQLGASGKAIEILRNLRDVTPVRRVRVILWAALVLVIGGGAILAVAILFGPKGIPPQASRSSSSPAITAPEKSIAVLPFENIGANKDDAYFADGVQDEILNNLARIAQLKVISRTSVMQYRLEAKHDLRQIAAALGVANVLEGTVRRDGNRVRVSTELIDAHNDNTVWADSYDRDLTDIFAIQSEIAQMVASKLSARLSPEEKRDIEEKPTDNLEAYDLYLQGRRLLENALFIGVQREEFAKPTELLEEATRKDPGFALAYCSIAECHDALYLFHLDRTAERRALGDAAVNEALRLRPDLPEAHLAAALHLFIVYRDYERARVQIAIAERALPNSPEVFWYRAAIDYRQGRYEEAIRGYERAAILDPRNMKLLLDQQNTYLCLRRFRQAERISDRLIELDPDEPSAKILKAYVLFAETADLKNYLSVFQKVPSSSEDRIDVASGRITATVYAHEWTNAEDILHRSANEEFYFSYAGATVPRGCLEIWLARLQRENRAMDPRFAAARDQLNRDVEMHPEEAELLSALGIIDAALGRKLEAIQEASRAAETLPISEDAESGPALVSNLAAVYALTNEPDLAFEELDVSVRTPGGVFYGDLKFDPAWDGLRADPRFDKLLARLAPKE
jgi:serine/threonine protein kinase/tetratricopeptide (TPR) repeat protein